jgi:hypothetical protein
MQLADSFQTMSDCRLIICEKTNHWASVLRWQLGTRQPQVVETRSLPGCEAALVDAPVSLVAVEVTTANLEAVLDFLARATRRFSRAAFIVFLAPEGEPAAAMFREAGAVDAITSVLQVPRVARLARRHHSLAPKRESTFQEFATERMPWPAHATFQSST